MAKNSKQKAAGYRKAQEDAPNLREVEPEQSCGNCKFFSATPDDETLGMCTKFEFKTESGYVCDAWAAVEATEDKPMDEPMDEPMPEMAKADAANHLKAVSETPDELRVANYIILFGGRDLSGYAGMQNKDGTRGEYFTKGVELESDYTRANKVAVDWEHGRNPEGKAGPRDEALGYVDWNTAQRDERGVFVERVLQRRNKFVKWLETLIKDGLIGTSSETVPGAAKRKANGEITRWPLYRDTLTVTPMEPRMMTQNSLAAAKALGLYQEDESEKQPKPPAPYADIGGAKAKAKPSKPSPTKQEDIKMDENELQKLIAENVAKALKVDREAQAAQVDAAKKEQERIDAAVKAATDKLQAEHAAKNRLPYMEGQAPAQTKYADTKRFDHLNAGETATVIGVLETAKKNVSDAAYKSLAIKLGEDKGEIGEMGRADMKAVGLDWTKANEINYNTANLGAEWIGTAYSNAIWESIRVGTFVVEKLPQIEIPQGFESMYLPLESTDPVWYKVAEATSSNTAQAAPVPTVTASAIATDRAQLTLAKLGARVVWSGELEEGSLVPFAAQLRAQLGKSGAEYLESAIIDGDTESGASTNINDIAGTPGSTDWYMVFNGFRKSPLVTTTANSRSAGGSLSVTDYLNTVKLMGASGINALDYAKVGFIVDPATYHKTRSLAEVLTKDVNSMPTIEGAVLKGLYGYELNVSGSMHKASAVRLANTAGKVDVDTVANNAYGAILSVRYDQWTLGWRRRMTMETTRFANSDTTEIVAMVRVGLKQRDTEAAAITYYVGV